MKFNQSIKYNNKEAKEYSFMGGKKLTINRKTQQEIIESIHLHRDIILKDMNLNLRLVNDEDHTYLSALVKWEKDF